MVFQQRLIFADVIHCILLYKQTSYNRKEKSRCVTLPLYPTNRGPANIAGKNWHKWLSCAWLHSGTKRQPTMKMAVSVKNDCWDAVILLPWWRDVTFLLSKLMKVDIFSICVYYIMWQSQEIIFNPFLAGRKKCIPAWLCSILKWKIP